MSEPRRWTLWFPSATERPVLLAQGNVARAGRYFDVMPVSEHEAELERLRAVEKAARWVLDSWDRRSSQAWSMPALRAALTPPEGKP